MATLCHTRVRWTPTPVNPRNGIRFTVGELQTIVGGYFTALPTGPMLHGRAYLIANVEGVQPLAPGCVLAMRRRRSRRGPRPIRFFHGLRYNDLATFLYMIGGGNARIFGPVLTCTRVELGEAPRPGWTTETW